MSAGDGMTPGQGFEGGWRREGLADDSKLECGVCWRVYDPQTGDPARGAAPGTSFLNLPEAWRCPECDSPKETFLLIAGGVGPKRGAHAQTMQTRLDSLLAAYRDADLAMAGLPIYNPRLRIAALGFRPDRGLYVGALITPWFLNIVLLPEKKTTDARASGDIRAHVFPSGAYNFSVVKLERVGAFEFCSLFSPMLEFDSQEAAQLAAETALAALYEPAPAPKPLPKDQPAQSRRTLLMGRRRTAQDGAPPA